VSAIIKLAKASKAQKASIYFTFVSLLSIIVGDSSVSHLQVVYGQKEHDYLFYINLRVTQGARQKSRTS